MNFLTPRVERLNADGTFQVIQLGGALRKFRPIVVLLSRELCAFALFETTALPAGRRRQAARLHARVAAPYVASAASLVQCGNDFGIWWWDLERVTPIMAGRFGATKPVIRPETLAQPIGAGWRIVQLENGQEAQYWRDRALAASAWRANRFDQASWNVFTRLVRGAIAAPERLPAASHLPIAPNSEALSLTKIELSRNQVMGLAAGSVAACLGCLTLFMFGQGLQLRSEAEAIRAESLDIQQATPRAAETRGLDLKRRQLAAYREAEERTNPATAMGAAVGIASLYDLVPTAVEVADGALIMTLPYAAARQIDELLPEFEGSGYFYDVRPRTDPGGQSLIIEMKVRSAAPPVTAGE